VRSSWSSAAGQARICACRLSLASNTIRGFLVSKGVYTLIDIPGAAITFPFGINNRGQIVGLAQTAPGGGGNNHGFLLARGAKDPFTPSTSPVRWEGPWPALSTTVARSPAFTAGASPASSPPPATAPRGRMA
jgi:hypothetical protein